LFPIDTREEGREGVEEEKRVEKGSR